MVSSKSYEFFRVVIPFVSLVAILFSLRFHAAPSPIPSVISESLKSYTHAGFKSETVSALKDIIQLMIAISIGLTAIVGFAIRNGLGSDYPKRVMNLFAICVYTFFLSRVYMLAYDSLAAIAIQMDRGYLFLPFLQGTLAQQAQTLVVCAGIALILLVFNLLSER